MELWAKIGEEKVKLQGSMFNVLKQLLEKGRGQEVKLLSFHTGQKERRRLKRELRCANKNLLEAARNYVRWYLQIEERKIKRQIKELKRKERINSKGITYLPKGVKERISQLEEKLNQIRSELSKL